MKVVGELQEGQEVHQVWLNLVYNLNMVYNLYSIYWNDIKYSRTSEYRDVLGDMDNSQYSEVTGIRKLDLGSWYKLDSGELSVFRPEVRYSEVLLNCEIFNNLKYSRYKAHLLDWFDSRYILKPI